MGAAGSRGAPFLRTNDPQVSAHYLWVNLGQVNLRGCFNLERCSGSTTPVSGGMHRLFAAIRPPEHIRDLLLDLMDDGEALRWQSDEQLHLTLRFMGEVERPQAEDIAAAIQSVRFEPFDLRLSGVGRFAHRRGGALWAGVVPKEPLAHLAAKIDRACVSAGLEPERRAFHPHITLARWNGREPDLQPFITRHADLRSDSWLVDAFMLYESHLSAAGASYEPVMYCKAFR